MQVLHHWHQTFTAVGFEKYNKGIIHVRKFNCYDILPVSKQEVEFDAHEFHLALVFEFDEQA